MAMEEAAWDGGLDHSVEGSREGGMEAQLIALYADREQLENELGVSDAGELIAMVRSLEAQLADLYKDKEDAE